MHALYRNRQLLPSLQLACLTWACEGDPPHPQETIMVLPNRYLEAIQEAEVLKHTVEQRDLEQQRIDALIGEGQAQPPGR